jgi:hypothetical protein
MGPLCPQDKGTTLGHNCGLPMILPNGFPVPVPWLPGELWSIVSTSHQPSFPLSMTDILLLFFLF